MLWSLRDPFENSSDSRTHPEDTPAVPAVMPGQMTDGADFQSA